MHAMSSAHFRTVFAVMPNTRTISALLRPAAAASTPIQVRGAAHRGHRPVRDAADLIAPQRVAARVR